MTAQKLSSPNTLSQGQLELSFEDTPNWASCYAPSNPKGEHPPSFAGVTVIEGRKYWVNVYLKLDHNGKEFASVHIQPWEER